MYSFSLKLSLYICSKFLWEGPGIKLYRYLQLTVKDSLRLFPQMKSYDRKEGREMF